MDVVFGPKRRVSTESEDHNNSSQSYTQSSYTPVLHSFIKSLAAPVIYAAQERSIPTPIRLGNVEQHVKVRSEMLVNTGKDSPCGPQVEASRVFCEANCGTNRNFSCFDKAAGDRPRCDTDYEEDESYEDESDDEEDEKGMYDVDDGRSGRSSRCSLRTNQACRDISPRENSYNDDEDDDNDDDDDDDDNFDDDEKISIRNGSKSPPCKPPPACRDPVEREEYDEHFKDEERPAGNETSESKPPPCGQRACRDPPVQEDDFIDDFVDEEDNYDYYDEEYDEYDEKPPPCGQRACRDPPVPEDDFEDDECTDNYENEPFDNKSPPCGQRPCRDPPIQKNDFEDNDGVDNDEKVDNKPSPCRPRACRDPPAQENNFINHEHINDEEDQKFDDTPPLSSPCKPRGCRDPTDQENIFIGEENIDNGETFADKASPCQPRACRDPPEQENGFIDDESNDNSKIFVDKHSLCQPRGCRDPPEQNNGFIDDESNDKSEIFVDKHFPCQPRGCRDPPAQEYVFTDDEGDENGETFAENPSPCRPRGCRDPPEQDYVFLDDESTDSGETFADIHSPCQPRGCRDPPAQKYNNINNDDEKYDEKPEVFVEGDQRNGRNNKSNGYSASTTRPCRDPVEDKDKNGFDKNGYNGTTGDRERSSTAQESYKDKETSEANTGSNDKGHWAYSYFSFCRNPTMKKVKKGSKDSKPKSSSIFKHRPCGDPALEREKNGNGGKQQRSYSGYADRPCRDPDTKRQRSNGQSSSSSAVRPYGDSVPEGDERNSYSCITERPCRDPPANDQVEVDDGIICDDEEEEEMDNDFSERPCVEGDEECQPEPPECEEEKVDKEEDDPDVSEEDECADLHEGCLYMDIEEFKVTCDKYRGYDEEAKRRRAEERERLKKKTVDIFDEDDDDEPQYHPVESPYKTSDVNDPCDDKPAKKSTRVEIPDAEENKDEDPYAKPPIAAIFGSDDQCDKDGTLYASDEEAQKSKALTPCQADDDGSGPYADDEILAKCAKLSAGQLYDVEDGNIYTDEQMEKKRKYSSPQENEEKEEAKYADDDIPGKKVSKKLKTKQSKKSRKDASCYEEYGRFYYKELKMEDDDHEEQEEEEEEDDDEEEENESHRRAQRSMLYEGETHSRRHSKKEKKQKQRLECYEVLCDGKEQFTQGYREQCFICRSCKNDFGSQASFYNAKVDSQELYFDPQGNKKQKPKRKDSKQEPQRHKSRQNNMKSEECTNIYTEPGISSRKLCHRDGKLPQSVYFNSNCNNHHHVDELTDSSEDESTDETSNADDEKVEEESDFDNDEGSGEDRAVSSNTVGASDEDENEEEKTDWSDKEGGRDEHGDDNANAGAYSSDSPMFSVSKDDPNDDENRKKYTAYGHTSTSDENLYFTPRYDTLDIESDDMFESTTARTLDVSSSVTLTGNNTYAKVKRVDSPHANLQFSEPNEDTEFSQTMPTPEPLGGISEESLPISMKIATFAGFQFEICKRVFENFRRRALSEDREAYFEDIAPDPDSEFNIGNLRRASSVMAGSDCDQNVSDKDLQATKGGMGGILDTFLGMIRPKPRDEPYVQEPYVITKKRANSFSFGHLKQKNSVRTLEEAGYTIVSKTEHRSPEAGSFRFGHKAKQKLPDPELDKMEQIKNAYSCALNDKDERCPNESKMIVKRKTHNLKFGHPFEEMSRPTSSSYKERRSPPIQQQYIKDVKTFNLGEFQRKKWISTIRYTERDEDESFRKTPFLSKNADPNDESETNFKGSFLAKTVSYSSNNVTTNHPESNFKKSLNKRRGSVIIDSKDSGFEQAVITDRRMKLRNVNYKGDLSPEKENVHILDAQSQHIASMERGKQELLKDISSKIERVGRNASEQVYDKSRKSVKLTSIVHKFREKLPQTNSKSTNVIVKEQNNSRHKSEGDGYHLEWAKGKRGSHETDDDSIVDRNVSHNALHEQRNCLDDSFNGEIPQYPSHIRQARIFSGPFLVDYKIPENKPKPTYCANIREQQHKPTASDVYDTVFDDNNMCREAEIESECDKCQQGHQCEFDSGTTTHVEDANEELYWEKQYSNGLIDETLSHQENVQLQFLNEMQRQNIVSNTVSTQEMYQGLNRRARLIEDIAGLWEQNLRNNTHNQTHSDPQQCVNQGNLELTSITPSKVVQTANGKVSAKPNADDREVQSPQTAKPCPDLEYVERSKNKETLPEQEDPAQGDFNEQCQGKQSESESKCPAPQQMNIFEWKSQNELESDNATWNETAFDPRTKSGQRMNPITAEDAKERRYNNNYDEPPTEEREKLFGVSQAPVREYLKYVEVNRDDNVHRGKSTIQTQTKCRAEEVLKAQNESMTSSGKHDGLEVEATPCNMPDLSSDATEFESYFNELAESDSVNHEKPHSVPKAELEVASQNAERQRFHNDVDTQNQSSNDSDLSNISRNIKADIHPEHAKGWVSVSGVEKHVTLDAGCAKESRLNKDCREKMSEMNADNSVCLPSGIREQYAMTRDMMQHLSVKQSHPVCHSPDGKKPGNNAQPCISQTKASESIVNSEESDFPLSGIQRIFNGAQKSSQETKKVAGTDALSNITGDEGEMAPSNVKRKGSTHWSKDTSQNRSEVSEAYNTNKHANRNKTAENRHHGIAKEKLQAGRAFNTYKNPHHWPNSKSSPEKAAESLKNISASAACDIQNEECSENQQDNNVINPSSREMMQEHEAKEKTPKRHSAFSYRNLQRPAAAKSSPKHNTPLQNEAIANGESHREGEISTGSEQGMTVMPGMNMNASQKVQPSDEASPLSHKDTEYSNTAGDPEPRRGGVRQQEAMGKRQGIKVAPAYQDIQRWRMRKSTADKSKILEESAPANNATSPQNGHDITSSDESRVVTSNSRNSYETELKVSSCESLSLDVSLEKSSDGSASSRSTQQPHNRTLHSKKCAYLGRNKSANASCRTTTHVFPTPEEEEEVIPTRKDNTRAATTKSADYRPPNISDGREHNVKENLSPSNTKALQRKAIMERKVKIRESPRNENLSEETGTISNKNELHPESETKRLKFDIQTKECQLETGGQHAAVTEKDNSVQKFAKKHYRADYYDSLRTKIKEKYNSGVVSVTKHSEDRNENISLKSEVNVISENITATVDHNKPHNGEKQKGFMADRYENLKIKNKGHPILQESERSALSRTEGKPQNLEEAQEQTKQEAKWQETTRKEDKNNVFPTKSSRVYRLDFYDHLRNVKHKQTDTREQQHRYDNIDEKPSKLDVEKSEEKQKEKQTLSNLSKTRRSDQYKSFGKYRSESQYSIVKESSNPSRNKAKDVHRSETSVPHKKASITTQADLAREFTEESRRKTRMNLRNETRNWKSRPDQDSPSAGTEVNPKTAVTGNYPDPTTVNSAGDHGVTQSDKKIYSTHDLSHGITSFVIKSTKDSASGIAVKQRTITHAEDPVNPMLERSVVDTLTYLLENQARDDDVQKKKDKARVSSPTHLNKATKAPISRKLYSAEGSQLSRGGADEREREKDLKSTCPGKFIPEGDTYFDVYPMPTHLSPTVQESDFSNSKNSAGASTRIITSRARSQTLPSHKYGSPEDKRFASGNFKHGHGTRNADEIDSASHGGGYFIREDDDDLGDRLTKKSPFHFLITNIDSQAKSPVAYNNRKNPHECLYKPGKYYTEDKKKAASAFYGDGTGASKAGPRLPSDPPHTNHHYEGHVPSFVEEPKCPGDIRRAALQEQLQSQSASTASPKKLSNNHRVAAYPPSFRITQNGSQSQVILSKPKFKEHEVLKPSTGVAGENSSEKTAVTGPTVHTNTHASMLTQNTAKVVRADVARAERYKNMTGERNSTGLFPKTNETVNKVTRSMAGAKGYTRGISDQAAKSNLDKVRTTGHKDWAESQKSTSLCSESHKVNDKASTPAATPEPPVKDTVEESVDKVEKPDSRKGIISRLFYTLSQQSRSRLAPRQENENISNNSTSRSEKHERAHGEVEQRLNSQQATTERPTSNKESNTSKYKPRPSGTVISNMPVLGIPNLRPEFSKNTNSNADSYIGLRKKQQYAKKYRELLKREKEEKERQEKLKKEMQEKETKEREIQGKEKQQKETQAKEARPVRTRPPPVPPAEAKKKDVSTMYVNEKPKRDPSDPKGPIARFSRVYKALQRMNGSSMIDGDQIGSGEKILNTMSLLLEWNFILLMVIFMLFLGCCCPFTLQRHLGCPPPSVCQSIYRNVLAPLGFDNLVNSWRTPTKASAWPSLSRFSDRTPPKGVLYDILFRLATLLISSVIALYQYIIYPVLMLIGRLIAAILNTCLCTIKSTFCQMRSLFSPLFGLRTDSTIKSAKSGAHPNIVGQEETGPFQDDPKQLSPEQANPVSSQLRDIGRRGGILFYLGPDSPKDGCNFSYLESFSLWLKGKYPPECIWW